MLNNIHVFLIGPGLIGQTLINQIKESNQAIKIVAIGSLNKMLFNENGINLDSWKQDLKNSDEGMNLESYFKKMQELDLPNKALVDCTASEEIGGIYKQALENNIAVITPNKKLASGNYQSYQETKQASKNSKTPYLYEVNVGAGLPVISTLKDLINTGDEIIKIEAILSGTLSYIFNTYDGTTPFSQVVKGAQEKGYTEPDPRDDLNGMDVARKILILARETGAKLELTNIEVKNLSPQSAQEASSVDEFFSKLAEHDPEFKTIAQKAHEERRVLRYIASFQNGMAKTELKAVDQNHPFYNMAGSDNIVSFTTKRYDQTPLVIKGPGAGAEVTAAGVFADILRIK